MDPSTSSTAKDLLAKKKVYTNMVAIEEAVKKDDPLLQLDTTLKWEYDVFLSFRGCDVRNDFVAHLDNILRNYSGLQVFKDDKETFPGDNVSDILNYIEKSMIAIVVISTKFASSDFCLNELVEIIRCKEEKGQIVLSVFYGVDISDVEDLEGTFGDDFKELEKKHCTERVEGWKGALSKLTRIIKVPSLNSFNGNDADLVNYISKSANNIMSRAPIDDPMNLVGLDYHLAEIEKKVNFKSGDSQMIGIWGMSGLGKTTIAKVIFNKYSFVGDFQRRCFLSNVKDKFKKEGATYLQKELLRKILMHFDQDIETQDAGRTLIKRKLHDKRVFIVLDDVDDSEQLAALAEQMDWFGNGSKVIVTTQNRHVLAGKGVISDFQLLDDNQSLDLFCRYAFKEEQPNKKDFVNLSKMFVIYAQRLPLALKLLGQSLYGRDKDEWESELDKLKRLPSTEITQVLKISYERLKDSSVKDVFLDIAFFFDEEWAFASSRVEDILNNRNCEPKTAIRTLEERALITIVHGHIYMHDLIQKMAYEIVKEESKDPCRRSRLASLEDVSLMLRSGQGKSTIEGIMLSDMSKIKEPIDLKLDAFKKLYRLRILRFCMPRDKQLAQVFNICGDKLDFLSHELSYFRWDCFPFKYWPSSFTARNLVELRLNQSKLESLWNREMELINLKVLDLSYNKCLKIFPNLSKAPNIEEIQVQGCECLVEFSSDLQHLSKVDILKFTGCKSLRSLPKLPKSLQVLNAEYCESLETLKGHGLRSLPKLKRVSFVNCKRLKDARDEILVYATSKVMAFYNEELLPYFFPTTQCIWPESQIPSWFSNKNDESSIEVEFPPVRLHQKFMIVFCVVFEFNGPNLMEPICIRASTNTFDSTCSTIGSVSESIDDTLMIWQTRHRRTVHDDTIMVRFDFHCKNASQLTSNNVQVKKCGVHFVMDVTIKHYQQKYILDKWLGELREKKILKKPR